MSCRFKNLKKVSLSLLVISSMISSNLTIYNAKEFKTNNRQLTEAKYDRSEGNDVYLSFGGGEKAKITFLKNSVFRFNVEPDGVFKSAPEPMAPTHTTKIVDKDEDEYIDEYEEIRDELVSCIYGVWDHLKNGGAFGCAGLEIDNRMHGADEFVEIECLKECVVIFAEAILRICGE